MKKIFLNSIVILLIFSACKSKEGTATDTSCNSCEDALIRYSGDPALDGCGWIVDVSSTIYMPSNLLPEFQEDNLEVRIKYKVLERVNCGLIKDKYHAIFIEEIQKKQ